MEQEQKNQEIRQVVETIGRNARAAALQLAILPTDRKNKVLQSLAELLNSEREAIAQENAIDLAEAQRNGLDAARIDRLRLTPSRIDAMIAGLQEVAALPDPVGEELSRTTRPNGILILKQRVPLGVIGIIYESRPNVTIDCAALCLKSGNAAILRGGSEAFHSNRLLASLVSRALASEKLNPLAVQTLPITDRAATAELLKLDQYVNCIIPRGGEGLIRFVAENARMPVLKHYKGVCSVFVHRKARPEMAQSIVLNAKTQRPGVCNAAENLLVDRACAESLLPDIARALVDAGVELRVTEEVASLLARHGLDNLPRATEEDFLTEYLSLTLAVTLVDDLSAAIDFCNTYSSAHSDAIITEDPEAARQFLAAVDSSAVFWNASTRFNDGFEFGLGAEIGISTDKLHARGPVGLAELTSYKYLVHGTGQIRT